MVLLSRGTLSGMQPVVYSEKAAVMPGGCGWHRSGTDIRYKPGRSRPNPTEGRTPPYGGADLEPDNADDGEVKGGLGPGRYMLLRKRLLRARASLTSPKQGAIAAKNVVDVTEVTRLAGKASEPGALRGKCVAGWFTMEPELMELVPLDSNVTGKGGTSSGAGLVGQEGGALLPKASSAMNCEPLAPENDATIQGQPQQPKKQKRNKTASKKGDAWADTECFYQLEMTLVSEHPDDTLFVAMAVPYSYTKLQQRLELLARSPHVTRRQLCTTLGGRRCDLLTVTQSPRPPPAELATRQHVVLSARVHPGETNASWLVSAQEPANRVR